MKCFYTNATSLGNKWDELKCLIIERGYPHVLAITETWFSSSSLTKIDGYSSYCWNRNDRSGGGVAVFVRDDLYSFEVKLLDNIDECEMVWCGIHSGSSKLLIGCIYRPPYTKRDINLKLNEAISVAKSQIDTKEISDLLIMGDFNFSDICWSNTGGICSGNGRPTSLDFLRAVNNNYLKQFVLEPTFGNKVLDLIFANEWNSVFNVAIGPPLGSSKNNILHSTLFFDYTLSYKLKVKGMRGKFDYNKANIDEINLAFAQTNWNLLEDEETDVDASIKLFNEQYWAAMVLFVPYKTGSVSKNNSKPRPKWFTNDLKKEISLKFKLFAILRASSAKTRNINAKSFNKQCRIVKKLVKQARIKHEMELAANSKSNPKMIYSYINRQKYSGSNIKFLINSNDEKLTNPEDISNCLNREFEKSFASNNFGSLPAFGNRTEMKCCISVEETFSPLKVKTKLDALDKNKSPGLDGIHPLILKKCSETLCYPISLIFKKSFKAGVLPSSWKYANVTPLFKKGTRTSPSNYRPISLTAILCKIKEGLIRDVMMSHLLANNLLSMHQHGFIISKSCTTNLIESLDIITEALNRGFYILLVLLDFAKAFDSVVHEFLLLKLQAYGFDEKIIMWISDFLSNRKQRVVMGDTFSEWINVTSGVPQGSVLGPLLFVIYINDMPSLTTHLCKLFADDSKLIGIIKNSQDKIILQNDLDILNEWSLKWKLYFNVNKCKVMEIYTNKLSSQMSSLNELKMCDAKNGRTSLEKTTSERDLGVTLNKKLKWNDHIENAVLKANNALGMLRKTFKYWSCKSFKQLYVAFVRPHLEYCSAIWNPHLKKDILKLERVQRRATKLIPGIRDLPYEERLNKIGLQTLEKRRVRGDLIQYFKIFKGFNRINWFHAVEPMASISANGPASGIRGGNHRIAKQLTKVESRANFLPNRIANEWNKLPAEIVNSKTVNQFKNRLDKFTSQQA